MTRVIVLTSNAHGTASRCLPELAASTQITVVRVVLAEGASTNASSRKRKLKKAMRIGVLGALNGVRIRPWFRGESTKSIELLCQELGIPLSLTDSVNSERTVELFAEANADLGVSLGNSYIARRVFSRPRFGMINLHGERLPEYQNAQSVIWPIYNLEATTGLSIHEIDDQIDTGRILHRQEYPIEFHPTLRDTVMATTRVTASRAPAAVRHVCENFELLAKQGSPQEHGRKYTTPSLREFLRMVRNNKRLYEDSSEARR